MEHPFARSLFTRSYISLGNGSAIIPEDTCFCQAWLESRGSDYENHVANVSQWIAFAVSVALLVFYAYEAWMAICGWEEVYVCTVELTKVILEFFFEFNNPAMIYSGVGNRVQWLRYGEWLLTCPVILIHLSNLTGLKEDYTFRTMRLLVSDIGTIVFGATSAMCVGYLKLVFFLISCVYGSFTFFNAGKVYVEAYNGVPKGHCQWLVKANAFIFFCSWTMYPVLFGLGPEGLGVISTLGSTIAHTYLDLMSKNAWGLVGHFLRVAVWRHVKQNGEQSVLGIRNSMSMARIDPGKVPRLSVSSQSGAVPPVSTTSGITWTTSGEQSATNRKLSSESGVLRPASSSPPANGTAEKRSHFWSSSGKHNGAVAPAPAAPASPAVAAQPVSVKSRANTASGMGNRDGDVVAASDVVVARITTSGNANGSGGPASAPVAALAAAGDPSSRSLQPAASVGGGWTDVGGGLQPPRSASGRNAPQERRTSIGSSRLAVAAPPAPPVEVVDDLDEDEIPAPPPPPADKRFSTEGMSRPATSQVQGQASPRTYPQLSAADI